MQVFKNTGFDKENVTGWVGGWVGGGGGGGAKKVSGII